MFRTPKQPLSALFVVAVFLLLGQLGSTVAAMCVYNKTNVEILVDFDCGLFCSNAWTTEPGNHYCRTGESGTVTTGFGLRGYQPVIRVTLDVDAHGYIEMTQPSSTEVEVCAYREDHSQAGCQSFDPTSSS